MSLSVDTILQAVDLVKKAIEIYHRVDGLPSQMTDLGRRLEKLSIFLVRLETFAGKDLNDAYNRLFSGQKEELGRILKDIRSNASKAYEIFRRYEQGILSSTYDIKFRHKWAAQIWFSLVESTPDKVEVLMKDIDDDRTFVSDYLALMNAQGIRHMINHNTHNSSLATSSGPTGFKVLFVDPYNLGRGVVAEGWLHLCMLATRRAKRDWPLDRFQSAGFFLKKGGDCIDIIENLDYTWASFKKPVLPGGQPPNTVSVAALTDNPRWNNEHREAVKARLQEKRSAGLKRTVFRDFDYIFVFTNREHDNMLKLKEALVKQEGDYIAPRGKGRLLMLGTYLSPMGEILDPAKGKDGKPSLENWKGTVSQLKQATNTFLKDEFGWKEPWTT